MHKFLVILQIIIMNKNNNMNKINNISIKTNNIAKIYKNFNVKY